MKRAHSRIYPRSKKTKSWLTHESELFACESRADQAIPSASVDPNFIPKRKTHLLLVLASIIAYK